MKDAGIPVPEFQTVLFSDAVKSDEKIKKVLSQYRGKSASEKSAALKTAVREFAEIDIDVGIEGEKFSVRSSSCVEDSAENSFAGQFDTYLNVDKKDIKARVVDCLCSLYNENVLDYLDHTGIDPSMLKMNVIIQKMVNSDVSGVVFTANPQGILNETVIVAGRGLGENVVSDKIDTTAYYYSLTDKIYYYDGKEKLLDDDMVHDIIDTSQKICGILGEYLDIEYAVENGKLYILQARPITTISDKNPIMFDNSNIVESYPGLSLPLTVSFVKMVYAGVFKDAARRILRNKKELEDKYPILENTVGDTNGRLYYNLNGWYSVLKFLPFSSKLIPIWQEFVGVKYKEYDEDKHKVRLPIKASIYFNTVKELIKTPKGMEELNKKFIGIKEYVYKRFKEELTAEEILDLFDEIEKKILSCWGITLLNDTYAFIFTGLLKKRMEKKYPNHEELSNAYISGISNIESMKPVKAMISIALEKHKLSKEEYEKRKKEFIEVYGDRCLEELKLETKTFRTNPELFDKKTDEYASQGDKLSKMLSDEKSAVQIDKKDVITRFLSKQCMKGIGHREVSRLNRSRIFGMVREAVYRLGDVYEKDGYIEEKEDIFYLYLDEIRRLCKEPENMKEKVEQRKKKYEMYKLLPAYSRIIFSDKPFDKNHTSINMTQLRSEKDELQGIPCSNGVVEGEAYVVTDVKQVSDVSGKILITKMTDPGWVFLLATAKGVVSEKGSLLSHTAIISRELGIPAVVGIENLMNTVNTGDIVQLDGSTGIVKIKKKAD